ncbi:MAG: hypothetical protein IPJ69_12090 [Deltaproteobacteria bacterium]|nr:MAG: hypothetical protein IPJ69_12090 [Deltaproteobacteria bacterium]
MLEAEASEEKTDKFLKLKRLIIFGYRKVFIDNGQKKVATRLYFAQHLGLNSNKTTIIS